MIMKIDNHAPNKVCVFLDELGIHLPYEEQLYWLAYNIPPEGSVSETFVSAPSKTHKQISIPSEN